MANIRISKSLIVLILLSLTASLLLAAQPISAETKTITVPTDYSTITSAIAAADPGDTILVKAGTYSELFTIDKALTLRGEDKATTTTIINGGNQGTVILVKHDDVTITGVTLRYADTPTRSPYWLWSSRLAAIHLLNVNRCIISGNVLLNAGCAVWLYGSRQNTVSGNHISGCDFGMRVDTSNNNTITGNSVADGYGGIFLLSGKDNMLSGNSMLGNTQNFGVSGSEPSHYLNQVDASNTVDGKPIQYWINVNGGTVPADAGFVALVNCDNVRVQGLHISKSQDGILLVGTRNCAISNTVLSDVANGINLLNTQGTSIQGNTVTANTGITNVGDGTKITGNTIRASSVGASINGSYNTVADNNIQVTTDHASLIKCNGDHTNITQNTFNGTSNAYANIDGPNNLFYSNKITNAERILVYSDGNIIFNNEVPGISVMMEGSGNIVCGNTIRNGFGLTVGGHDNSFYANQIENNYYVGVDIGFGETGSFDNTIYHNNIVNNNKQVKNFGGNLANHWNKDTLGNYWSNYNGTDANGDGIGDTPHIITDEVFDFSQGGMVQKAVGQDNYPLMTPFDIASVTLELPDLTYVPTGTLPTPTPTPTATPTPTSTVAPTQMPTETPTSSAEAPSPTPSLGDTNSSPPPAGFPPIASYAIAAVAAIIAIAVAIVLVKMRK